MKRYIARRLLQGAVVMWMVATAVFVIFRIVPGDPAAMTLGFDAPPEAYAAVRRQLGLDDPLFIQYFRWIGNLLRGDLGIAVTQRNTPVADLVFPALLRTLELATLSILVAVAIAIPLGMMAAIHESRWIDHAIRFVTTLAFSMPTYVLAIGLLLVFADVWAVLPPGGYVTFGDDPVRHLKLLVLPVVTIGTVTAAPLTRFMRAGMLGVLQADYVRTARAKGVEEHRIRYRHAFRNAAIPLMTEVGVSFGMLVGGMVVIEQIFAWPGLGWLMIQSILTRSFDVVQAAVLLSAAFFVVINLIVDIAYSKLDPRIARS
ncbi:MAG TPA: ABC transporter permease [Ilumatobacteraceae bacterium]|nr:ABC transporter permease [Ilumatobacteraceae bacterium]